jgi:hypothetical protein
VSFAAINLCVASQRVFIVVSVYFFSDSVRKLLDTHPYMSFQVKLYLSEPGYLHGIALGYGLEERGFETR